MRNSTSQHQEVSEIKITEQRLFEIIKSKHDLDQARIWKKTFNWDFFLSDTVVLIFEQGIQGESYQ